MRNCLLSELQRASPVRFIGRTEINNISILTFFWLCGLICLVRARQSGGANHDAWLQQGHYQGITLQFRKNNATLAGKWLQMGGLQDGNKKNMAAGVCSFVNPQRRSGPASGLPACAGFLHVPGGTGNDSAQAVAVAPDGCIWVCGYTESTNFPAVNPIQAQRQANQDAFISKFSPMGTPCCSRRTWGSSGASLAMGIAVDGEGDAYVCGYTDADNFPTLNAFQPARNGY